MVKPLSHAFALSYDFLRYLFLCANCGVHECRPCSCRRWKMNFLFLKLEVILEWIVMRVSTFSWGRLVLWMKRNVVSGSGAGRSAAFPRRPVSLIIKTLQLAEWPDVEMISSHSCCGHGSCSVAVTRAVPLCHYLYILRTEHINKNLDNIGNFVIKYDQ